MRVSNHFEKSIVPSQNLTPPIAGNAACDEHMLLDMSDLGA